MGVLRAFGGVVLADEVGLGKTYVALAAATQFKRVAAIVPATLVTQWDSAAARCGVRIRVSSLEGLSRGKRVPASDLVVVDEAHRFRNAATRRYATLSRDIGDASVLLVTATPLVNRVQDLANLLRLFLPDHALAAFGVPSLEAASDALTVGRAAAPLIVARAADRIPEIHLPRIVNRHVFRAAPLPNDVLGNVLGQMDSLRFPTSSAEGPSHLLRYHLLHRLSSSGAAAQQTIRRHLTYLDRASTALESGQPIPRGLARRVLGAGDDMQLELLWSLDDERGVDGNVTRTQLTEEQQRLRELLLAFEGATMNPKARHLRALLARRTNKKTIVFVSCVATGIDLARRLRWRSLAFVGAGRARISTGTVAVGEVLKHFAPHPRCADEQPHWPLTILIATDLVSEGLNLQTADGIVHYDLPWTPVRLAQRAGRVARLGAEHRLARVWWFTPPRAIDQRMRLSERLHRKALAQEQAAVATTSHIGRSRVLGSQLLARANIAREGRTGFGHDAIFAVVEGRESVAAAVIWDLDGVAVPDLLVLCGDPPTPIVDFEHVDDLLRELRGAVPTNHQPPPHLTAVLHHELSSRVQAITAGPANGSSVELRRSILERAIMYGRTRDIEALRILDATLSRVVNGVRIGTERQIVDAMRQPHPIDELRPLLRLAHRGITRQVSYRLQAVVFGVAPPSRCRQ